MRLSLATGPLLVLTLAAAGCSDGPSAPSTPRIRAVPGSERQITRRDTAERLQRVDLPDWSPDGNRISFVGAVDGVESIWTVKPDGTEMVELIAFGFYHSWSPDGSQMACSVFDGAGSTYRSRILLVPVAGGVPDTITPPWMIATDPDWSPDGMSLVVTVQDTAVRDISDLWVFPTDGGDSIQLTADSTDEATTAWSPDGRWIAFAGNNGANGIDLFLISTDGAIRKSLTTTTDVSELWPAWSPDGNWLAFDSDESGNIDIWAMHVTGGPAVPLTDDPAYDGRPTWSPDGKKIAFKSRRAGGYDIWTIDVDTVPVQ